MDPEDAVVPSTELDARIRRVHPALLGFLLRRCPGEAEELAQEVWLRVTRVDPACPTDAAFKAYAFTTARRVLVDAHRRRRARVHLVALDGGPEATAPPFAAPDARAHADDVLAVVDATLAAMKPELAEVFRWRTSSDLSFAQIAQRQQVSVNTALGRMHQAVNKLHAALDAAGLLPEGGRS